MTKDRGVFRDPEMEHEFGDRLPKTIPNIPMPEVKPPKKERKFSCNEEKILLDMICARQIELIISDSSNYGSQEYKDLESLKIKIKDM